MAKWYLDQSVLNVWIENLSSKYNQFFIFKKVGVTNNPAFPSNSKSVSYIFKTNYFPFLQIAKKSFINVSPQ